jgi:hypothetical protein
MKYTREPLKYRKIITKHQKLRKNKNKQSNKHKGALDSILIMWDIMVVVMLSGGENR